MPLSSHYPQFSYHMCNSVCILAVALLAIMHLQQGTKNEHTRNEILILFSRPTLVRCCACLHDHEVAGVSNAEVLAGGQKDGFSWPSLTRRNFVFLSVYAERRRAVCKAKKIISVVGPSRSLAWPLPNNIFSFFTHLECR